MSWAEFQRQYDAVGRDKADGYAPGYFDGMSDQDLARARAMMLERALAGDTIDLSGLRYIGDADTVVRLAAMEESDAFDWNYDITRHEVLFELTGDPQYLTSLARYLDGRDAEAQERVAGVLAQYVLPPEAETFVVDRIVDGEHEAAVLSLIRAWIAIQQRSVCDIMCFQRHLDLIRSVNRAKPRHRAALLTEAAVGLRPQSAPSAD